MKEQEKYKFGLRVIFKGFLNNFNIELGNSAADGIGKPGTLPLVDLNNTARSATAPSAGAYEAVEFPDL